MRLIFVRRFFGSGAGGAEGSAVAESAVLSSVVVSSMIPSPARSSPEFMEEQLDQRKSGGMNAWTAVHSTSLETRRVHPGSKAQRVNHSTSQAPWHTKVEQKPDSWCQTAQRPRLAFMEPARSLSDDAHHRRGGPSHHLNELHFCQRQIHLAWTN